MREGVLSAVLICYFFSSGNKLSPLFDFIKMCVINDGSDDT